MSGTAQGPRAADFRDCSSYIGTTWRERNTSVSRDLSDRHGASPGATYYYLGQRESQGVMQNLADASMVRISHCSQQLLQAGMCGLLPARECF